MSNQYHFSGSRTSVKLDEPLHLTKFIATFVLPPALQAKYGTEIISEQLKKIGGLSLDKMPETVEQMYKNTKRKFIGTVTDTSIDLEMEWEVNVTPEGIPYPYNALRDWCKLCYDFQTGFQVLKKDHVGQITIEVHDKIGTLIRKYFFPIIFPITAPSAFDLEYGNQAEYKLTLTFAGENPTDLLTNV